MLHTMIAQPARPAVSCRLRSFRISRRWLISPTRPALLLVVVGITAVDVVVGVVVTVVVVIVVVVLAVLLLRCSAHKLQTTLQQAERARHASASCQPGGLARTNPDKSSEFVFRRRDVGRLLAGITPGLVYRISRLFATRRLQGHPDRESKH